MQNRYAYLLLNSLSIHGDDIAAGEVFNRDDH